MLLLVACSPPEGYDPVRAACGLSPGEHVAIPAGLDRVYRPLDEACVEAVGGALGVEWEGFGEAPHAVDSPDTPAERLVAGAFTLLAADVGATDDVLGAAWLPSVVGTALDQPDADAADATDAAALWWTWLADGVEVVRYDADPVDVYTMRYVLGVIEVSPLLAGSAEYRALSPVEAAAILTHEASHRAAPPHVPCPDTGARACG